MSSNRARKSTGPRPRNNTANNRGRKRLSNSNNSQNSILQLGQSSSDSEAPTQPLRPQNQNATNNQSLPGPSGLSSQATLASSDSDFDGNTSSLRLSNQGRRNNRSNQQEQSSSETTSDSDEVLGQERVREDNFAKTKKRKTKKPKLTPRKPKRNSAKKKDQDSDSEADDQMNSSVNTLNLSQRRNLAKLVNDCVYFLLIADQKKHAIKRQDIIKHIFVNQDNKLYNSVIEEADKVLKKTYGMEILVSEKRKGEYMLINCLDRDLNIQEFCDISPGELQKRGLVFYLLTIIFMNENSISEEDLCEALKPLGIDLNSRTPHHLFGDVRKYLTVELVKQMYLEYRCLSKDPPQFEFSWGIRAKQEVDKKDLLQFACQIMNDTKPEDWILQYKDAMDSAKEQSGNTTQSRN